MLFGIDTLSRQMVNNTMVAAAAMKGE